MSRKTVKGEGGTFEIALPRERDGGFEPRVPKVQTPIDGLDDKTGSMAR